jgi:hypothetical protein
MAPNVKETDFQQKLIGRVIRQREKSKEAKNNNNNMRTTKYQFSEG